MTIITMVNGNTYSVSFSVETVVKLMNEVKKTDSWFTMYQDTEMVCCLNPNHVTAIQQGN